jgi:hypothetical protein
MTNNAHDERLQEIVRWFLDRDVLLGFDNVGGKEWHAIMLREDVRIGAAAYAVGTTKLEAAETAQRHHEAAHPAVIEDAVAGGGTVTATVQEAVLDTGTSTASSTHSESEAISEMTPVSASLSMPYEAQNAVEQTVKLPYEVRQVERVLTDYGWRVAFTDEPDGSVTGYLMAEKTGDVLKAARGEDFHDAYLGLGIDTYPPSEEVRRENR